MKPGLFGTTGMGGERAARERTLKGNREAAKSAAVWSAPKGHGKSLAGMSLMGDFGSTAPPDVGQGKTRTSYY
jgi:hypothetical protein